MKQARQEFHVRGRYSAMKLLKFNEGQMTMLSRFAARVMPV